MSYDIDLISEETGEIVEIPIHEEGGTYVLGGTDLATLSVTYNYGEFYYETLNSKEGIRCLDGMRARDATEFLSSAIEILGTERSEDYWEATPGNAGAALATLRNWGRLHPDAIWSAN